MSSKSKTSSQSFAIGDVVLHKMRGYPAWPGKIVPQETVSGPVLKEKPRQGLFHCVRYYPKGDHSWAAPRDLKTLDTAAIDAYIGSGNKKAGELLQAYQTAKDPSAWDAAQQEKAEAHRRQMEGVDELEDDEPDHQDEDELDEDGEAGDKRKRSGKAADKKPSSKKAKTEKKAKAAAPSKAGKNSKVKSSANVESEEDDTKETNGVSSGKAAAAPAATADGEADSDSQKVKEWRHKLQRAFLGKLPPQEKDMPLAHEMFSIIEGYTEMTIQQLQVSKIGKVMRKIAALTEIPRESEFEFKKRALALIGKWQSQLASAGASEEGQANGTNGKDEE